MRRSFLTVMKIMVSATLIAYLFAYKVNLQEVLAIIAGIKPAWLIAGASLHITGLVFSALRWKVLLKAQSIQMPLMRLFTYYLVGHFFNMFLPTQIGGDVVRIYDTSRDHGSAAQPFAVVVVERISGMITLLLIASLVLFIEWNIGFDIYSQLPGLKIGIALFIAMLCLIPACFHPMVERRLCMVLTKLPVKKVSDAAMKIFKAFQIYGGRYRYLLGAVLIGIVLQINFILHYYFIARALSIPASPSFYFVIIPIRCVALMIPFFINGIGLREFFDVSVFNLIDVSKHSAIAFAETAWMVQIFFALFGGLVYVARKPGKIDYVKKNNRHESSSTT